MTVVTPPRSGVAALTPTQVRWRLLEMGWIGIIPIVAHDGSHRARGKAPAIRGWGERAVYGGFPTKTVELSEWERKTDCPGTGIVGGNIVIVDADFAVDPLLANRVGRLAFEVLGRTPFVRQGQAPKIALLYRAAEPIQSIHLKAADGSKDGIDILGEGAQIVAFGVHPKTLVPYSWIGGETPLTAGPEEAPEVSVSQIETFIGRLRELVDLNGTGGRIRQSGRSSGSHILRDADGRVIDGREYHLTRVVYATALSMEQQGETITADALAKRAWATFAATTNIDDGLWSYGAAATKAAALLDRVRRGLVRLNPTTMVSHHSVTPTYPDRRISVVEAEAATRTIVERFFSEHVPAWKATYTAWELEVAAVKARDDEEEGPHGPAPISWAARIETAIGKTAVAISGAAAAAKAGSNIVYAAPTHALLAELAERFAAEGATAQVYRGYTSPDPNTPGAAMCLDLEAMQDARDAGSAIQPSVCEQTIEGQKRLCAFHHRCGMQRQRKERAQVWLIPHALLFQSKPGFIPRPDAVVIDEGITLSALPDQPVSMSLDEIEKADFEPPGEFRAFTNRANDLASARGDLVRALRAHQDGPLNRSILLHHDVTSAASRSAYSSEWRRHRDSNIKPGMSPETRKECAAQVGGHNREVKRLAGIWKELRGFLESGVNQSGRINIRYDQKSKVRILERWSLNTVRSSWSAPILLLDATLPEAHLIEPVIGHTVDIKADITAVWSEHVGVRQILGAPVTAQKLGIIEGREPAGPRRIVGDLLRMITLRAALVWPRTVVVIGPQRLIEILLEAGLPPNVETGHFGAVAGIDRWSTAAGLICIGRLQPGPRTVEPMAGIVTGQVPEVVSACAKGIAWYPCSEGGIRLESGEGVQVEHVRHPDPVAEGLRWQITEAGLIQAVGRLRALRRGPGLPAFLDIIGDIPLPISIGNAVSWNEVKPGAWVDMATDGILLESAADVMACFPEVAPTPDRAKAVALSTLGVTSVYRSLIDVTPNVRRVLYKRRGRYPPAHMLLLPNAPANLRAWLTDRLGSIEWIKSLDQEGPVDPDPMSPFGLGLKHRPIVDQPMGMSHLEPSDLCPQC